MKIGKIKLKKKTIILAIIFLLVCLGWMIEKNTSFLKNISKNINPLAKETMQTETTYQITETIGNTIKITIHIKNELGITKIITPKGMEIIPQNENKTEIAIDEEIQSGNDYIYKIQINGSEELKDYILKADTQAKPMINQTQSYQYALLKEHGIDLNKIIDIDYGENSENYYSLDNGKTWKKYTGNFKTTKRISILAKTIVSGEITKIDQKEITFELANDAMGLEAYDKDEKTYIELPFSDTMYFYMTIDNSMINKEMTLRTEGSTSIIVFYDENNNVLSTLEKKGLVTITIPENSVKVGFAMNRGAADAKIYEIAVNNAPKLTIKPVYPQITQQGIKQAYNKIKIEYFNTSENKLYSIDNGVTWLKYQAEQEIELPLGSKIIAKGIDQYGTETPENEYLSIIQTDAVEKEAYDGDRNTFMYLPFSDTSYSYMAIDNLMMNKDITLQIGGSASVIVFYDANNNEIFRTEQAGLVTITIPDKAVKVGFAMSRGAATSVLYEVIVTQ